MASAEQFQTKVEAFLEACESLQERGLWEEEEYESNPKRRNRT